MRPTTTKADVTATLQEALSDTARQDNSMHAHAESVTGHKVTKTLTCNGNGAQTDNIFVLTGSVLINAIKFECTEATNSTTLSGCYLDLYDSTASIKLTESVVGVNLSGIAVGGSGFRDGTAASALAYLDNAIGSFVDGGGGGYYKLTAPFRIAKKASAATYLRFCFTGDADTDVDLKFTVFFNEETTGAGLVAA